jgi:hypothetical protein
LTRELLETLVPVDLDDLTYSGRYNTSYLGEVVIPAKSISTTRLVQTSATSVSPNRSVVVVYYGSATSVEGEERRFLEHEHLISLSHDEILFLHTDWQGTHVSNFHALATMEGAQHRFIALHRFPQVPHNPHVGFHCRALARVCENINLLGVQKLDISSSDPQRVANLQLLEYFNTNCLESPPKHRFHVANRCLPMLQAGLDGGATDSDVKQYSKLWQSLENFYLRKGIPFLPRCDMENIVEDVEGVDLSKIPELELRAKEVRVRSTYASVLRHYGQTFQYTWYKDFRIDMAIIVYVIRYTSSHGLVNGPDQFDVYKFKSILVN